MNQVHLDYFQDNTKKPKCPPDCRCQQHQPIRQKKVIEHRNEQKNSVLVVNWDDILFPTSECHAFQFEFFRFNSIHISVLESRVMELFLMGAKFGRVVILTNATKKWIEDCSAVIFPAFKYLFLDSHAAMEKVSIFSKKDKYDGKFPKEQWNEKALNKIVSQCEGKLFPNIVFIGHSEAQMDFSQKLSHLSQKCLIKRVFFKPAPTSGELLGEMEALLLNLNSIYNLNKNLTVRVTPKIRDFEGERKK